MCPVWSSYYMHADCMVDQAKFIATNKMLESIHYKDVKHKTYWKYTHIQIKESGIYCTEKINKNHSKLALCYIHPEDKKINYLMVNVLKFQTIFSFFFKYFLANSAVTHKVLVWKTNSVDPDQTSSLEADWSGSALFICFLGSRLIWVCTVCLSLFWQAIGVGNFRTSTKQPEPGIT